MHRCATSKENAQDRINLHMCVYFALGNRTSCIDQTALIGTASFEEANNNSIESEKGNKWLSLV